MKTSLSVGQSVSISLNDLTLYISVLLLFFKTNFITLQHS